MEEINNLPDIPTEGPQKNVIYHNIIHPGIKWAKSKVQAVGTFMALTGNQTIGGIKTFTNNVIINQAPTGLTNWITKAYADSVMNGTNINFDTEISQLANQSVKINSNEFNGVGDLSADRTISLKPVNTFYMAPVTKQYQVAMVTTIKKRSVGAGDLGEGFEIREPGKITSIIYRIGTSDASGTTTIELRKNDVAISGTSASITGTNKTASVTGSWAVTTGDRITVYTTAIGATPGLRLTGNFLVVPD